MKKITIKSFIPILLAGAALALTSCDGIIFSSVRDEVELEDSQVSGDINSIVRYAYNSSEYLYTQNGDIWYKDVTDSSNKTGLYAGEWNKITAPDTGYICKLAADSTNLYALSYTWEDDDDDGENVISGKTLYYSLDGGSTWSQVDADVVSLTSSTSTDLFCTNAPVDDHRVAFINVDGTVYRLDGENDPVELTSNTDTTYTYYYATTSAIADFSTSYSPKSAVYVGTDTIVFSPYYAMTTNEVSAQYSDDDGTTAADATYFYYASSDTIYYVSTSSIGTSSTIGTTGSVDSGTIYAMAVTSSAMMLGTSDGIAKVTLSTTSPVGVPSGDTLSFSTNADSTLSSYYEVWCVLSLNPGASETGGDIYGTTVFSGSPSSTSATFDDTGLWAYYPVRGNWNRE